MQSCIKSTDFIARFGGDEFCIILNTSHHTELNTVISKIHKRIEKYNHQSNKPYKLSFSMGYDIYDYKNHMSAGDFLKHIDQLMYIDKKHYKMTKMH